MTLDVIIHAYIRQIRPKAQAELDWFAHQPSLRAAIKNAALASNSRGKRYSHQRRLTKRSLERGLDVLSKQAGAIEQVQDFGDLFNLIDAALEPIPGLGVLYVYDTSLRIGTKLNLFPDKVYLHAGTRLGAGSRPARQRGARRIGTAQGTSRSEAPRDRRCFVHLQGRIERIR